MAAQVTLEIDLSGWKHCLDRVHAGIDQIPTIEIGPRDVENRLKAQDSFDRGDMTYPLSGEAKKAGGSMLARGLKAVAHGDPPGKMHEVMLRVGENCTRDIKKQIQSGAVEGPARSPGWIARKGNDINMLGLTGDFIRSLTSKPVK